MATLRPERLTGIHLNLVIVHPPDPQTVPDLTEQEKAALALPPVVDSRERGYSHIQGTKPQTLAYGSTDSPAGLAGWIVEKFRTWSDCGGDVESCFTKDELLANITGYWATGTIGSSARLYYESLREGQIVTPDEFVTVPTGCALFPAELMRPSRRAGPSSVTTCPAGPRCPAVATSRRWSSRTSSSTTSGSSSGPCAPGKHPGRSFPRSTPD